MTPSQTVGWPISTAATLISGERLPDSSASEKNDSFLQRARERFKICCDAEAKRREEMLTDLQFSLGIQWDPAIRLNRGKRPCLTINRIPGFVDHVSNNMRQSRPGLKVDPVGDGADEEIADIRQGLLRHIEVNSNADVAYDTAFHNMCVMGLGWMRIVDDWADPYSFDQSLFVRWVPNTFSVYSDPNAAMPDWSDMKYAFVVEDLSQAEFIARFGKDKNAGSGGMFESIGDHTPYWYPGGKIRIAEYFHVEYEEDTLLELADGSTVLKSTVGLAVDHLDIRRSRKCKIPVVHWALISAADILKERIWKGQYIPLIPVIGNQTELDGDRIIVGMVRYAREPQRLYNYMYSSFVETVALAPRNQFIAEFDQISEFRDDWENANTSPQAVLVYRMKVSEGGQALPPPQRQSATVDLAAFVQGLQMADQNLKSVFQIFEASLGQRGPQESGLAINARKIESDTGTYNWGDNFIRSLRYLGVVLNDLLQYYYNSPGRIVTLIGEDDEPKTVPMNQAFEDKGEQKIFDLSKGKFAVVLSTGESFQTRRKESAKSMLELAKIYPPLMQIAGDKVVREMDWPGKDAIASRLEKALPPGIKEPDEDAPPIPPEFQQRLAEAMQTVQGLTQALQQATDKNLLEETKQFYETLRTEMKLEGDRILALIKVGSDEAKFLGDKQFQEAQRLQALAEPGLEQAASAAARPPTPVPAPTNSPAAPPTGSG